MIMNLLLFMKYSHDSLLSLFSSYSVQPQYLIGDLVVKNLPVMQETQVQYLGQEDIF